MGFPILRGTLLSHEGKDMADSLQVIQMVHSFYSESFSQLMYWTLGLLAFAGILMPLWMQHLQNKASKLEKESLESLMRARLGEMRSELTSLLSSRFTEEEKRVVDLLETKVADVITSFKKDIAGAKGGLFHLQGLQNIKAGFFSLAITDCAVAMEYYMEAFDERNLQANLHSLCDTCLPKVSKEDLENDSKIEASVKQAMDLLETHNENGRYALAIGDLESGLQQAKLRSKKTATK